VTRKQLVKLQLQDEIESHAPADAGRELLPDAKGMVELAATRLIRESTASRVRDILGSRQKA